MSDVDEPKDPQESGGKKGLILGLLAALLLGGGGFYATYSGLIGGQDANQNGAVLAPKNDLPEGPDVAFVQLTPMVISLGSQAENRHLRFSAQLEVPPSFEQEVTHLIPRVLDVLNGYLRAVDSRDIESPASLGRLRAQMLRRVQVVTGKGRVRDLLVTEFVLN